MAASPNRYLKYLIGSIQTDNDTLFQRCLDNETIFSSEDWTRALVLGALAGRSAMVRKLVSLRADSLDLNRGLEAAASGGNTRILSWLKNQGADLHENRDFPFHLAIGKNRIVTTGYIAIHCNLSGSIERSIRYAHDKGLQGLAMDMAGLVAQSAHVNNALAWAVRNNRDYVVVAAALAGADTNVNDGELLLRAIRDNRLAVVKALLVHGADLFARGEQVAISAARASGSAEMIAHLQKHATTLKNKPTVLPPTARMTGMTTVSSH